MSLKQVLFEHLTKHIEHNISLNEKEKHRLSIQCDKVFSLENEALIHSEKIHLLSSSISHNEFIFILLCEVGSIPLVSYYLNHIADTNFHILDDYAINVACSNGHIKVVKCLLDYFKNHDSENFMNFSKKFFNDSAYNSFKSIACKGHKDMVKFLVDKSLIDSEKVSETIEELVFICHCNNTSSIYKNSTDIIHYMITNNSNMNEKIVYEKLNDYLVYNYDTDINKEHIAGSLLNFSIELCAIKMHNKLENDLKKKKHSIQKAKI